MHYKLIAQYRKTDVLIFETGDELASGLKQVAVEAGLASSSFIAHIGQRLALILSSCSSIPAAFSFP
jgi:hypothetical protein